MTSSSKMKLLPLIILVLVANGCGTVPFRETERVALAGESPESLVLRFQDHMPDSFQLINSIVFEYNWRTFAGIGYLDIDRGHSVFSVACLNPMGVKLFELSGDRNTIANRYTIAALNRYGDITAVVGNDIRRIYFDLVPSAEARVSKGKYTVRFRQPAGEGRMEYVFAGAEADLIEKNYYDDDGIVWRASYHEYREQGGKRFPQGIVFRHYNYGYRLTVRQKELHS
jgi:Protein of unknown function (DUF3261)